MKNNEHFERRSMEFLLKNLEWGPEFLYKSEWETKIQLNI